MKPPAPVTLVGRLVRLEPLTRDHLPALAAVGLDPDLWQWTVSRVRDEREMTDWLEGALAEAAAGRAVPFVILDCATGLVIGSTRYGNISVPDGRLEIGWTWLGRSWQRSGRNAEAKLLLLAHAFDQLGASRVEFKTDALNAASRAALRALGALEEGVLRRHTVTATGRVRDTVYFGILAEEWPEVRKRLEERLRERGEGRGEDQKAGR
ncbi:MAG TPA: GNAT family N-acetyltransferase [Gemmatimonadales bacterium]|nr:GNAT family N-acetyltransferase [Gemmatimonadales bacterium]